ncbi:Carnitine dehydratase [Burkholderiales bacterium 8X]|nr:Carnitine dehydratase [Burkholderiales bacterium 8X]
MDALRSIWRGTGLPDEALQQVDLAGRDPVLPSSFAVGAAAQASIAAAALAACELGQVRGTGRQQVSVDLAHAAAECIGWFSIDGKEPALWDRFSGLYRSADGWVRLHANFAHHRDGALRLLGLDPPTAERADAEAAMRRWTSLDFETAAAEAGLVAAALRTFDEWDATPQAAAIAAQPLFRIRRIGDAPPLTLPSLLPSTRPLAGVKVLELTRILAGPVGGRTLAAHGADVMLVNSPRLPNIASIAETSRGKLSAHLDLTLAQGREDLWRLLEDAHVFVQGYRPGGLAALGFDPATLAARRPGIVCVSLSAYGSEGPWAGRRGFDSLVQTAMGFNAAEAEASGAEKPRALPMQILDQATGYLMAMCTAAALVRQQREGGSWLAEVSLAQTGHWLRGLGRVPGGGDIEPASIEPWKTCATSGFGELSALGHSATLDRTPPGWDRPSMPPGSHPPAWP